MNACGACLFHVDVRVSQCGGLLERDVIAKTLCSFYVVELPAASSCDLELIGCLSGDLLSYVFSFLSLRERNNCSLVCRQWLSRAFRLGDPRIFTDQHVQLTEARDFFRSRNTIARFGGSFCLKKSFFC